MSAPLTAQHHPDCYPSRGKAALAFFQAALEDKIVGPNLSPAPQAGVLGGVIAPHIDFRVSLAAHAVAYRPLLAEPMADDYLILGVGHRSELEWNLDRRDYETPLGRAICARELVDALAPPARAARFFSPAGHEGEHSIEFPLVWLQAIHQLHGAAQAPEVRFVPLLCGGLHAYVEGLVEWDDLHDFHHLSRALAGVFQTKPPGRKLRLIVSIDGCHLGPRFRHPFPVTSTLLKVTEGWEKLLWACAEKGDARAFLDWFRNEGNDRYFDGVGALALLMAAGAGRFTLERTYYEQWFTLQDASAVTFSSGVVMCRSDFSG